MIPERIQELCALRLYGELDPAEERELESHLAASPEARAWAEALGAGLGRLVAASPDVALETDDLPADWRERLQTALRHEPVARRRWTPWITAAAGFAAGLLCTGLTALLDEGAPRPTAEPAPSSTVFARSSPPPLATGRGLLSSLGAQLPR